MHIFLSSKSFILLLLFFVEAGWLAKHIKTN